MNELLDFFEMCGVDRWNFSVLEPRKDGRGECMKGDKRCRGRLEVEKCLPWGFARNSRGFNVYIRPARLDKSAQPMSWPIIFLDDLTPSLALKIVNKYRAIAVETSTGNCQVWLACDRPLAEDERKEVQSQLILLLRADIGSKSGEHFGRAVGFRNKKPTRMNEIVKILSISTQKSPPFHPITTANDGSGVAPPAAACVLACRSDGSSPESHKEFIFACESLKRGGNKDEIVANIAARALGRGKRSTMREAEEYALRTLTAAEREIRS